MKMFTLASANRSANEGAQGHVTFYSDEMTQTIRSNDPEQLRKFARSFEDAADQLEALQTTTMTVPA